MKARIPQHREFIINFPDSVDQAKASEGWNKLTQIVEDYKKAHNGASVYAPTFIWLTGVFFCMSPFRGCSFTVFPLC